MGKDGDMKKKLGIIVGAFSLLLATAPAASAVTTTFGLGGVTIPDSGPAPRPRRPGASPASAPRPRTSAWSSRA